MNVQRLLYLTVTLAVCSPVLAEESVEMNRLALFENAQRACKMWILSNAQKASLTVNASTASLQSLCECAALLTVANTSSEVVTAIAAGDKGRAQELLPALQTNFNRCLTLRSSD
jgi:hypothetical protein